MNDFATSKVADYPVFNFQGRDASGVLHVGKQRLGSPAAFVEGLHTAGWTSLTVLTKGHELVGEIHGCDGEIVWWAN